MHGHSAPAGRALTTRRVYTPCVCRVTVGRQGKIGFFPLGLPVLVSTWGRAAFEVRRGLCLLVSRVGLTLKEARPFEPWHATHRALDTIVTFPICIRREHALSRSEQRPSVVSRWSTLDAPLSSWFVQPPLGWLLCFESHRLTSGCQLSWALGKNVRLAHSARGAGVPVSAWLSAGGVLQLMEAARVPCDLAPSIWTAAAVLGILTRRILCFESDLFLVPAEGNS